MSLSNKDQKYIKKIKQAIQKSKSIHINLDNEYFNMIQKKMLTFEEVELFMSDMGYNVNRESESVTYMSGVKPLLRDKDANKILKRLLESVIPDTQIRGGSEENRVGKIMAQVIFMIDHKKIPESQEIADDYAKSNIVTSGHKRSINEEYVDKMQIFCSDRNISFNSKPSVAIKYKEMIQGILKAA